MLIFLENLVRNFVCTILQDEREVDDGREDNNDGKVTLHEDANQLAIPIGGSYN